MLEEKIQRIKPRKITQGGNKEILFELFCKPKEIAWMKEDEKCNEDLCKKGAELLLKYHFSEYYLFTGGFDNNAWFCNLNNPLGAIRSMILENPSCAGIFGIRFGGTFQEAARGERVIEYATKEMQGWDAIPENLIQYNRTIFCFEEKPVIAIPQELEAFAERIAVAYLNTIDQAIQKFKDLEKGIYKKSAFSSIQY